MKKLLALVLALVMSMSLVTISNAAYSDAADVDYKEAVDVMSAVGVFQGADGKFSPKAELTREQAAKLIAYLDLGEKTAEALPAVKVFNDVEANRWSAKYVAYCADAGYLAGVGDNNFDPAGKLTGYAFGKLLLCVLGYDATIEGYTGANWSINVAKAMQANDIAKGVDKAASAVLTREEAAQYCLNTLKADMVEYDNKGTNVTINGATIATGASAAKAVETTNTTFANKIADEITGGAAKNTVQLGEKLYNGKLVLTAFSSDAFNRSADGWVYDGKTVGTYTDSTATLTYTTAVSGGTIYTDLGKPDAFTIDAVYVDGDTMDVHAGSGAGLFDIGTNGTDASVADEFAIKSGNKAKIGGNGTLVEVYKGSTANHFTFVIVNTYVDTIATWSAAKTDKDGDITTKEKVTLTGGLTFETTAFEKADETDHTVVLLTKSHKGGSWAAKSVVAAEKVEDVAVTSYTTSKVNGYSFSANKTNCSSFTMTGGATYDLYLDSYGYVINADTHTETNTAYVQVTAVSSSAQGDAGFGQYYNVKYVDMAGKTTVVKTYGASTPAVANRIYTVAEDADHEGYYKFTLVATNAVGYSSSAQAGVALTENSSSKSILNKTTPTVAAGIVANAKTTYVLCTDNTKDEYKVIEGLANVPGYTASTSTDLLAYAVTDGTYAKVIFIDLTGITADSASTKDVIYLVDGTNDGSGYDAATKTSYYVYDAVVDGKYTQIKSTASSLSNYGLVTQTFNANGFVTATAAYSTNVTTPTVASKAISYSEPTLTIADAGSYLLKSDVVIYLIDTAEETCETVSAADLVGTGASGAVAKLIAVSDKDATVETIYFVGTITK